MKKLVLFTKQKMYIKYRNLKDRLCNFVACPFCVKEGVVDTG